MGDASFKMNTDRTVHQRGGGGRSAAPAPVPVHEGGSRRRAYSWRGESSPYEKPNNHKSNAGMSVDLQKLLPMMGQEARCVSAWVVGAASIQVIVSILVRIASFAYPLKSSSIAQDPALHVVSAAAWWHEYVMVLPSVIAGCLLRVVPPQVVSDSAPGFIYASAWLLLGIKHRMGSLPHIPSRICEAVLGRLSVVECCCVVAVQFICTLSTVTVIRYCFLTQTPNLALTPIEYTSRAVGDGNPWIVDYFVELLVNTVFTVMIQVIPVLLRLNGCPQWLTLLFVYPLYTIGVDRTGKASTLSPSILLALGSITTHRRKAWYAFFRCLPQILGGLVAGRIMTAYFPDEEDIIKRKRA